MNTKHLHQIVPAVLAAGFLVAACGTASAQSVLLSDSFNTGGASGSVDSFNGSAASRQTGSLTGTGYTSKGALENINANQVVFAGGFGGGGPSRLFINNDFASGSAGSAITTSGGFTISYNFFAPASASGSGNWLGIIVGETSAFVNTDNWIQINNSATPFGMLLKGNGGYQSFSDGTQGNGSQPALTLNYGSTANQVVLTFLTTSFASGSSATVSATVNGTAINLGADANITWGAGGQNYIQFEDYQNDGYGMNNLVISTVPEPGTMTLAALGGASLLFWRRRSK